MSRRPSYAHGDLKGWCGDPRRGAALGRGSGSWGKSASFSGYAELRRVIIDRQGYDRLGTYWGDGTPLWWCATNDHEIDFCIRSPTRESAEATVRKRYPNIKFYKVRNHARVRGK